MDSVRSIGMSANATSSWARDLASPCRSASSSPTHSIPYVSATRELAAE